MAPSTASRTAVLAALVMYRACRLANDTVQTKQLRNACQGISLVRTCYTAGNVVRFQISQYSHWYSRKGTTVWYLPWHLACLNLLHSRLCCALADQPVFTMNSTKGSTVWYLPRHLARMHLLSSNDFSLIQWRYATLEPGKKCSKVGSKTLKC